MRSVRVARSALVGAVVLALGIPVSGAASAPGPQARSPAGDEPPWGWPTGAAHVVYRPFIAPASRYGPGHRGVDLASAGELIAPAEGVVSFAGVVVDRGVLSIDHGGGVVSSYEPVRTALETGDRVRAGDVMARVDDGHCSEQCVHLGVRVDGEYVSPLLFLGGVPRAVLLPTRALG